MITFETQEDFDKAVMQVLHKRLTIVLETSSHCGTGRVEVNLYDHASLYQDDWELITGMGDDFSIATS